MAPGLRTGFLNAHGACRAPTSFGGKRQVRDALVPHGLRDPTTDSPSLRKERGPVRRRHAPIRSKNQFFKYNVFRQ